MGVNDPIDATPGETHEHPTTNASVDAAVDMDVDIDIHE